MLSLADSSSVRLQCAVCTILWYGTELPIIVEKAPCFLWCIGERFGGIVNCDITESDPFVNCPLPVSRMWTYSSSGSLEYDPTMPNNWKTVTFPVLRTT